MRRPGVCVWGAFWFFITDATTRSQHFNVSKKKEEAKSFFFLQPLFPPPTHPALPRSNCSFMLKSALSLTVQSVVPSREMKS